MTAVARDRADPLARFVGLFAVRPGEIYLDGNSLGLLCRPAEAALSRAIDAWRELAIRGWTDGPDPWFAMSRDVSALLAPLVGAEPADVAVGRTTTDHLHQILATFYDPADRTGLLIDALAFPTDRYAVESHLKLRGRDPGRDLVVVPSDSDLSLDPDRIIAAMGPTVGLAVLPAVVYTTGQLLDLAVITRAARERGILVAWDCSHSAGVVPHAFRREEIDLAFGCTYKYLNGGPGSPGWLYVHPRHRDKLPGMAGWFGCEPARQFEMSHTFHPAADASRYLTGTPSILSLAPLLGSLPVIADAGIAAIRAKSLALTGFLRDLVETRLLRHGVHITTPCDDAHRGGHITLAHPDAGQLGVALRARGVIPDVRPPNLLRLAPAPLYSSFADCEAAIEILDGLLTTGDYREAPHRAGLVT